MRHLYWSVAATFAAASALAEDPAPPKTPPEARGEAPGHVRRVEDGRPPPGSLRGPHKGNDRREHAGPSGSQRGHAGPHGSAGPHGPGRGHAEHGEQGGHGEHSEQGAHGDRRRAGGPGEGFGAELQKKIRDRKVDKAELKKSIDAWRSARDERRRAHRDALVARWGSTVSKPNAESELALHAKRLARLQRMDEVVALEKAGTARERLLERIEKLRSRELERHASAMQKVASGSTPFGTTAAPAASPPAAGTAP